MIEVLIIQLSGDNDLIVNGKYKPRRGTLLNEAHIHDTLMEGFKILIEDGQEITLKETPRA